jgi:low affinity Fe/Cu permease
MGETGVASVLQASIGNLLRGGGCVMSDPNVPDPEGQRQGDGIGETFRGIAHAATLASGSWQFFILSLLGVLAWFFLGPLMGYTDTWQLIINTPTTVLTYLLGILILLEANRQAKESKLVHDELLRAVREARTELVNVDTLTDKQIDELEQDLRDRAEREKTR